MKKEESERIATLWFEDMWSKPDLSIADQIVGPDYNPIWIHIDKIGPDQIKHEIKYFRTIFPDLKYEIVEMKGEEKKVWIRYRCHATHLGGGWGFQPTRKEVEFEGVTILYLNSEGKVRDQWGAFCFYDILADLGLVPPFWELHKHFPNNDE
ncbi:MAG: ester cyclase [Promethearchaeota archaeon]|jgi:predicted ester cyclase